MRSARITMRYAWQALANRSSCRGDATSVIDDRHNDWMRHENHYLGGIKMARILVAEDDQFTRDMVQRALETDGHIVTVMPDGGEALAASRAGPPFDLVITDVEMPNMSGIELTEGLLSDRADQRIIIMSGLADELARARALVGGNVRMITKPVTLEKIRGEATELLA